MNSSESADQAPSLREQLRQCLNSGARTLSVTRGVYHCFPDLLPDKYCFISNNDEGQKRIVFDLDGARDLVVDGNGSELIMHGWMLPFVLRGCRNVTLRNWVIDWAVPFLRQAEIVGPAGYVVVRFDGDNPYRISGQFLEPKLWNMLEFDPQKAEPAVGRHDNYHLAWNGYRAQALDGDRVRVEGKFEQVATPGNLMVLQQGDRIAPAITIDACENIRIENVTVHHAAAMALIAQVSHNIHLDRFNVCRRPGTNRVFSAWADASHFTDCTGDITFRHCLFECQMDDGTNIHGIYRRVTAQPAANVVRTRALHHQQFGIQTMLPGDPVGFYDARTFALLAEAKVAECRVLNREVTELVLENKLPALPAGATGVMRHRRDVAVSIEDCEFRNNRARGLLLSSLGRIRVRNNRFHTSGPAIKISGDMNYWFESGPVEDVEITGNVFDACAYTGFGHALFDIDPEIEPAHRSVPFHRNIRIHGNTVRCACTALLRARCVDGLTFTDNAITDSPDYPVREAGPAVELENCVRTTCSAPTTE